MGRKLIKERKEPVRLSDEQVSILYNKLATVNEKEHAKVNKKIKEIEEMEEREGLALEKEEVSEEVMNMITGIHTDEEIKEPVMEATNVLSNSVYNEEVTEEIEEIEDIYDSVDFENIEEDEKEYNSIFDQYDLTDEETTNMLTLLSDFKAKKKIDYATVVLPKAIEEVIKGFTKQVMIESGKHADAAREFSIEFVLNEFIKDAKYNTALNEFSKEMNETMISMNIGINDMIAEETQKILDPESATNPEVKAKIEKLNALYAKAASYELVSAMVDSTNHRLIKKRRYKDECWRLSKMTSNTKLKMPDLEPMADIIVRLAGIEELIAERFCCAMMFSFNGMDFDDIFDIAYIYKCVSNITNYAFIDKLSDTDEHGKAVFANITTIANKLI